MSAPEEEPKADPGAEAGAGAGADGADAQKSPAAAVPPAAAPPSRSAPWSEPEPGAPAHVDPMIAAAALSEQQRLAYEQFVERSRMLALACLVTAAISMVVVVVSLVGRTDVGVLFFVMPTGVANALFGVLLRRSAALIANATVPKQIDQKSMATAFSELSRAFAIQTIATALFGAMLLMILVAAVAFRKVSDL